MGKEVRELRRKDVGFSIRGGSGEVPVEETMEGRGRNRHRNSRQEFRRTVFLLFDRCAFIFGTRGRQDATQSLQENLCISRDIHREAETIQS
jgi:hypothetical protein